MTAPNSIPSSRPSAGFSLIEVTLSIGIISFAFLALFGLLPVGLQVFRGAMEATARAQIAQQLVTRAQQTEFSNISKLASASASAPTYYYYNDQAMELPSSNKASALFTAAVTYEPATALPVKPGDPPAVSARLATLRIDIYNNKGVFNSDAPVDPKPSRHTIHLADFGQRL